VDQQLSAQMALVRRVVELGRSARAGASLGIRQPLPQALVGASGFAGLPEDLRDQIAAELNVRAVEPLSTVGEDLVDHVVKPNFRTLGRRFGNRTQAVAAAITAADPVKLASELETKGETSVTVEGSTATAAAEAPPGTVDISRDEVIVTQTPRAGWRVATEAGETVALELSITPELRREGLAREVIRLVQDARKADGLDVSDRILFWWESPDPDLGQALAEHGALIAGEVLAGQFRAGRPDDAALADGAQPVWEHTDADLALTFYLQRA
jgi:isoleucyl-tRNA synthetase